MPVLFDNYYLLVPTSPAHNPTVLEVTAQFIELSVQLNVIKGITAWLMVDQTMFSLDGLTCDQIGVSYVAFWTQSGINSISLLQFVISLAPFI